ncbi:Predicted arabinose efflux permease, MFS family [Paenibacillus algorifonticola]|uniref:Predicted arabinose efflux permease, MFS family n=1 Tax=Paenibacillus algorifonticola TaxID=684063 RepID=A0A1I2D7I6_9BACL|nr:MFS transporter [Paenibacillus algorifonticola]SFE76512.1 Predicted arabinose efflux permease, MFS family [Paenibacillus algorifonticola]
MDKRNRFFIFILTIGVFGILNTEMGIVGILPLIADHFHISVSKAGLLVSLFALAVAISGPTLPLLFSGINRKKAMLLVLGVFVLGNIVSIFASNFTILLLARVIPAFLHPVYVTIALTAAAASVSKEDAPKATSKVFMGVTGGLVLGAPVSSFIASTTSLEMAMLFYTIVNAIAFIAIFLFVPSIPVKERLSYGSQLSILKKSIIWLSIVGVIFINAAMYGVSSFLAEYLETITNAPGKSISLMLFLFGGASIIGNIVAGKLLTRNALKSVASFPFVLATVYIILFLMGQFTVPMALILFVFGIVVALGNNISQYWITSAAPEAPEFSNGLFLASANLGVTAGTSVGGLFISGMGTQYVVLGGFLFLILSVVFILMRTYMYSPTKQLS